METDLTCSGPRRCGYLREWTFGRLWDCLNGSLAFKLYPMDPEGLQGPGEMV